jgi:hypothetical protein
LTEIETRSPTVYTGLHGDLTVTKARRLGQIGIVHFDDSAAMSIASDILKQGHMWEFQQVRSIDTDAFLVYTQKFTYRFQRRDELYVFDLADKPELRHLNVIPPRMGSVHPTIVLTPKLSTLYTAKLPTTTANEAEYSKREVA